MRSVLLAVLILIPRPAAAVSVPLDLSGVRPGPVGVARADESVTITWPDETGRVWRATFSLDPAQPLVTSIGAGADPVVSGARPFYQGETGKRRGGWYAFFDDPTTHPDGTRHVQSTLRLRGAIARSVGERVEIVFDGFRMGSFDGGLAYTFYPGSRLVQQEAVLTTYDADVAYYYDAGLEMAAPSDRQPGNNMRTEVAFYDTEGALRRITSNGLQAERVPVQARYRTLALKTAGGSVAVFPAPHQYFLPRDFTSNLGYVWHRAWRGRVVAGHQATPRRELAVLPVGERTAGTAAADGRVLSALPGRTGHRARARAPLHQRRSLSSRLTATRRSARTGTWPTPFRRWPTGSTGRRRSSRC